MDAATLTAARAVHNQGPDGDRVFVVACQLGKLGIVARAAWQEADREVRANDHLAGHQADARVADRLIELVNATDPGTVDAVVAVDLPALAELHEQLAGLPAGVAVFLFACVDGVYGDAVARVADAAIAEVGTPRPDELGAVADRVLQLAAQAGAAA